MRTMPIDEVKNNVAKAGYGYFLNSPFLPRIPANTPAETIAPEDKNKKYVLRLTKKPTTPAIMQNSNKNQYFHSGFEAGKGWPFKLLFSSQFSSAIEIFLPVKTKTLLA